MSLNWKEINKILEELHLEGASLQQIHQPVHQHIVFEMYSPREGSFSLLISFSQANCRLHRLTRKMKNPQRPQRFAAFLRSRARGGRIIEARQLGDERIIKIVLKKGDEQTVLWVRLWGNAANMVVTTTEGEILDACYRRKKRGEISGGSYNPEENWDKEKPLRELEARELEGEGDFNSRVEKHYFALEKADARDAALTATLRYLDNQESYLKKNLKELEKQKTRDLGAGRFKEIGDLIMARLSEIKKGDSWLVTEDFYHNNQQVEIELNRELSPGENAENYYKKYQKAKRNLEHLEEKLLHAREALEKVQKQREAVRRGEAPALDPGVMENRGARQRERTLPGLAFSSGSFKLLVGRTAAENDKLLRRHVRGNDWWFHARDYAGGYVFVRALRDKSVPLEVLLDAGSLALFYSKGKNSGRGDVYYTQVKYLRRAKHGKQGLVIPTQEKNLHIVLEEGRMEKLKNSKEFY